MKKWIFVISILASVSLLAKKQIIPNEGLPTEFKYLLQTFNELDLTDEEQTKFIRKVDAIKESFKNFDKAEIYLLTKTEIYKSVLQSPPSAPKSIQQIKPINFTTEQNPTKSKFFGWIYEALYQDYLKLQGQKEYEELKSMGKLTHKHLTPNQQVLKRKLEKIESWASFYTKMEFSNNREFLHKFTFETLAKLELYSKLHKKFAKFDMPGSHDLANKLYLMKSNQVIKRKTNLLDDLIPNEDNASEKISKNSNEQWKPREDIDLFPKPDPNYVPPKELPKPTNDWNVEL